MKIFGTVLLVMSGSAFASSTAYDLRMNLAIDGKHVSSPRVIVKEGASATITQEIDSQKQFIEVIATESKIQKQAGVRMKFVIGLIGANGERTILARPQVIATEGKPAQITQNDTLSGEERLSLSVTAHKTTF